MSYKKPLAEREHALEEAYFRQQNQHLIDRMRARREAAEKGEAPDDLRLGTILVATDFSTGAAHATDMAIDYAKKFGAKLVLVHAYDTPITAPVFGEGYVLPDGLLDEIRKAARDKVEEAAREVGAAGVACEGVAVESPAAIAVVEEARERQADLIVMGTRGLTGLKHLALGSVAERVVRTAPCPVLAVPAP